MCVVVISCSDMGTKFKFLFYSSVLCYVLLCSTGLVRCEEDSEDVELIGKFYEILQPLSLL